MSGVFAGRESQQLTVPGSTGLNVGTYASVALPRFPGDPGMSYIAAVRFENIADSRCTVIPEHEYQRIKQRFVRLDNARKQEGNGLGLSLVDAIARQHGATLRFEDNHPGLRARMCFPARRANPVSG